MKLSYKRALELLDSYKAQLSDLRNFIDERYGDVSANGRMFLDMDNDYLVYTLAIAVVVEEIVPKLPETFAATLKKNGEEKSHLLRNYIDDKNARANLEQTIVTLQEFIATTPKDVVIKHVHSLASAKADAIIPESMRK